MMLLPERLAELKAIAEKATPGKRTPHVGSCRGYKGDNYGRFYTPTFVEAPFALMCMDGEKHEAQADADAAHIAAFDCETTLALIAAAERTAALEAACKAMAEWGDREDDRSVSFDERAELCKEAFALVHAALAKEPNQ